MRQFGRTATLIAFNSSTNEKLIIDGGILSDGSEGLRIAFNIQKSGVAINTAEIMIYNLSGKTIEFLSSTDIQIEFYAGYIENKNMLFKGEIKNVTNERQAPDHVVTIYSSSGLTSTKSSFSNTVIQSGDNVADAVKKLLNDITDLQSGFIDKLPECKKWIRSQTISGSTFDVLDRLGTECGFTVNVDDDKVNIYKDDYTPDGENLIVISKDTGLIDIPSSTEIGVDFRALLNPSLVPFSGVQIESKSFTLGISNAGFYQGTVFRDGRYGILTSNFIGDTNGSDWSVKCKTKYWGSSIEWKN